MRVNQVRIQFTNKPITSWGGMCSLIAKYFEVIGFQEWVERSLPIEEVSNNARGIYPKVLAQGLTMLTGGTRFSHVQWWSYGIEVIKQSFDVAWLPATSTVLTRFWGKMSTQAVAEPWGDACRRFAVTFLEWEEEKEGTLRFDSHVIPRYGQQERARRGYNPKKPGRASHHPLLAFTGTGHVVNCWNRAGNVHSGQGIVDFFVQTVAALGSAYAVTEVYCDSRFYDVRFIEYLEHHGYRYIIAVRIDKGIIGQIAVGSDRKDNRHQKKDSFHFHRLLADRMRASPYSGRENGRVCPVCFNS